MRKLINIGLAAGLAFQVHSPVAAGRIAAATVSASAPQDRAAADWPVEGLWRGRVGASAVMACFDGSIGSFYRLRDKKLVTLWADDALQFAEADDRDAKNPRWRLIPDGSDRLSGERIDGENKQVLRLQRLALNERSDGEDSVPRTPCTSLEYHRERLERLRVVETPETVGDAGLVRIVATPPHNPDDVEYRTFRLTGTGSGVAAVNKLLARFIDLAGPGHSEWTQCLIGAGNVRGTFHAALDPVRIGQRFMAVNEHREGSCGGAHPSSANYPRIFDLEHGSEVKIRDWLSPRALDRETLEIVGSDDFEPEPNVLPLSSALRQVVMRRADKRDDECAGIVEAGIFWTVGLGSKGFLFSPQLGHAVMACGQDVEVPYSEMARFLSSEGKGAVAVLRAERALFIPRP